MKINVDLLKDYKSDFGNEKSNFNSSSYGIFSSGYISKCSDSYVIRMRDKLKKLYQNIEKSYKNIDFWWEEYNNDIENLEKALSNGGRSGAIRCSSIRNSIDSLPLLGCYSLELSGIINLNFESNIPKFDLGVESVSVTDSNVSLNEFTFDLNNIKGLNDFSSFISDMGSALSKGKRNDIGSDDFYSVPAYKDSLLLAEGCENDTGLDGLEWLRDAGSWLWDNGSDGLEWLYDRGVDGLEWLGDAGSWLWDKGSDGLEWLYDRGVDGLQWLGEAGYSCIEGLEVVNDSVNEALDRTGATIIVGLNSVAEGALSFGEAVFVDAPVALFGMAAGVFDEDIKETTKSFVSKQHVKNAFDYIYENYSTDLVNDAYFFNEVREIGNGIGYTFGVVGFSSLTLGAAAELGALGTAGASAATVTETMVGVAGFAGFGRGVEQAWQDGADFEEGIFAGGVNALWEGFQWWAGGKISKWNPFKGGKISTTILNGLFRIGADSIDGGFEGIVQPFISSIYRDGYYDDEGNYIEFTENDNFWKRYTESFDDSGGWYNVGIQAGIGGFSSLIGEAFDLRKNLRETDEVEIQVNNEYDVENIQNPRCFNDEIEVAEFFNDPKQYLFQKLKALSRSSDDEAFKQIFNELTEIDPRTIKESAFKGKGKSLATVDVSESALFEFLSNKGVLTNQDYDIYMRLKNNEMEFSQLEKDAIFLFTAWYGPELAAYNRKATTDFGGQRLDGNDLFKRQASLDRQINLYNRVYGKNMPHMSIDEFNSIMDKITQKLTLKEDLIVYRGANSLFNDGAELSYESIRPGQMFNDKSHISTSVIPTGMVNKHKYVLEIKLPKDTTAGYIETVTGVSRYGQQELLLGRNNNFKITDYPEIVKIGNEEHYKVKVELVPSVSTPDLDINVELEPPTRITVELESPIKDFSEYAKMYNVTNGFSGKELMQSMKDKNLMGRYNDAVNDMHIRGLYDGVRLGEHDYNHVGMVLLNAIYMGNELGLSQKNLDILMESAKYHDSGLKIQHSHNGHPLNSVKVAEQNLQGLYSKSDLAKIKSIIEYHEGKESLTRITEICNKNGIFDSTVIDEVYKMANILRDADGMDFARFPGMLDTNFYRNKELANKLTPALFDLREEIAANELSFWKSEMSNKIHHGNLIEEDKKIYQGVFDEIINLQNLGKYPQFLINFARKYHDTLNFGSITECIEAICKNRGRYFRKP